MSECSYIRYKAKQQKYPNGKIMHCKLWKSPKAKISKHNGSERYVFSSTPERIVRTNGDNVVRVSENKLISAFRKAPIDKIIYC